MLTNHNGKWCEQVQHQIPQELHFKPRMNALNVVSSVTFVLKISPNLHVRSPPFIWMMGHFSTALTSPHFLVRPVLTRRLNTKQIT